MVDQNFRLKHFPAYLNFCTLLRTGHAGTTHSHVIISPNRLYRNTSSAPTPRKCTTQAQLLVFFFFSPFTILKSIFRISSPTIQFSKFKSHTTSGLLLSSSCSHSTIRVCWILFRTHILRLYRNPFSAQKFQEAAKLRSYAIRARYFPIYSCHTRSVIDI